MNEKQKLLDALNRAAAPSVWARTALAALQNPNVAFTGNPASDATNTAASLLRIYRIRQRTSEEHGVNVHGIPELLESLAARLPDTVMRIQPFRGRSTFVVAFWDPTGQLVNCVTVLGGDPERGRRNWEIAMGKR